MYQLITIIMNQTAVKTHNTRKASSKQVSILIIILCMVVSAILTSCSSNGYVYMPSKASKKLTKSAHIGCYAKK